MEVHLTKDQAATSARPSPEQFVDRAQTGKPGWSNEFGGPEGVARHTLALQEVLKEQAAELAAIRAEAIHQLVKDHSLAQIATKLGITKQAVSRALKPNALRSGTRMVKQW